MKKMTKALCLVLAAVMMLVIFASCGKKEDPVYKEVVEAPTLGTDQEIWDEVFADFNTAYAAALEAKSISERYALMAVAEAKLLEAGVLVPLQAQGGNYAISKVVPYTIASVSWGSDSSRYHTILVCTEPIKPADRDELKALYAQNKGTGTYPEKAKALLEQKGYKIQDSYSLAYTTDPGTFDVLSTSKAVDSDVLVHTYDGLMEYNGDNLLQPALAEKMEVSEDGLTYTFTIRQGVKWVDSTGGEVGDLKAEDFVTGFQHMLDMKGGLEALVNGIIVGVDGYLGGDTDFTKVGVKATGDYTVEYTLTEELPYFETMLAYSPFAPLNKGYFESQGGKLGEATNGNYGTDKDHIAYCGPYIIDIYTAKNIITFKANESYWNKETTTVKTINMRWVDVQSNATASYDLFSQGLTDGAGLNSAAVAKAKEEGKFDTYAYVSSTNATIFPGFLNLHRRAFANYNDATKVVSSKTDGMKNKTQWAMLNKNFRLALIFGFDRASYLQAAVGEELKYVSMVNTYTPGNFVVLSEDVTIPINGKDTTFKKGSDFGVVVQAQVEADGFPITAYDPKADGGLGSSAGYDGWYNPDKAKEYMDKAVEELTAQGLTVTKELPITIDFPYTNDGSVASSQAQILKESIEKATDGRIRINLVEASQDDLTYATYDYEKPTDANYDLQLNSGWGPDYGDPSTYLDTMMPFGYMKVCYGLDIGN